MIFELSCTFIRIEKLEGMFMHFFINYNLNFLGEQ